MFSLAMLGLTIQETETNIAKTFPQLFLRLISYICANQYFCGISRSFFIIMQAVRGVEPITDGYNPATWMLDVTTPARENALNLDFAEVFRNSDMFRYSNHYYKRPSNSFFISLTWRPLSFCLKKSDLK